MKKGKFKVILVGLGSVWLANAADIKLVPLPASQEILRENGKISVPQGAKSKTLDIVPEGGFFEGKLYEFSIRFSNCNFAVRTGKSYSFEVHQKDGSIKTNSAEEAAVFSPLYNKIKSVWYGLSLVETSPGASDWASHHSRRSEIVMNYMMPEQTFANVDNVARWQEKEADTLRRDLTKEEIRLGMAITKSELRLFVNGVFACRFLRKGAELKNCVLRIQNQTVVADAAAVSDLSDEFQIVDISERINASGIPGFGSATNLPAGGSEVTVGGVPFCLPRKQKLDHLDLSMSWMETAMRTGYDPTQPYMRWREGREKVPLRYQFTIPYDQYDALYVLAASDAKPDTIPRFTAQFYLRGAIHSGARPINFPSSVVPFFSVPAAASSALPLLAAGGKTGFLHLVKVDLEPGQFRHFSENGFFEMELTKDVQPYRSYPDPIHHSIHGAGLPSSVRIFGITLARSPVKTVFDPDALGNVWLEGEKASYTVRLENSSAKSRKLSFEFRATSYDKAQTYTDHKRINLPAGAEQEISFAFNPKQFGHYDVTLVKEDDAWEKTFARSMAYLRKRDHTLRHFYDKGMFYGCWEVYSATQAKLAALMGLDSFDALNPTGPEAQAMMERYNMMGYMDGHTLRAHGVIKADKTDAENIEALRNSLPDLFKGASSIREPVYSPVLCEPGGIGNGNAGFGQYYGEAPYDYSKLTGKEKERYELYKKLFLMTRKAILETSPKTKILLPNGNWTFAIPFLQDPETRDLFVGVKMDYQFYQRLPEQQIHQCSIHSMLYFWDAWRQYKKSPPILALGEGPGISQIYPGANDAETAAALQIRSTILMAGYGVRHHHSIAYKLIDNGESHCSGGFLDNPVTLNPHFTYSAFATFSRHTRNAEFVSYANPGSFSAYCANFRDTKSGKFFQAIWSIRGTREFIFDVPKGVLQVYDPMDNLVKPEHRNGQTVVRAGQIPVYVYGANEKTGVSLGVVDNCDSKPGAFVEKLGNAAELLSLQAEDQDDLYVNFHPEEIRRFYAKMEIATVPADHVHGENALAVTLPKQEKDRGVMPYFTCLKPAKPLPIAGKASHILLWVKANSDWGRVVYVLRDAKNRLWYSVGMKGQWNCDDMPADSVFCFDGWRLLRYEMPANAPWDSFRELGTTRWGSDSSTNIVELPLSLEKIFVERRSSVMYGNALHKMKSEEPVLLGDIFVEYAQEADMGDEVVRISRVRAPEFPAGALPNPMSEMTKTGVLPPGRIIEVKDPDTWFDGTRGVFAFEMPPEAVSADIWLSLHPDGRGALRLGKNLKASPAQVSGFLADTEFYAFLVYSDKDGKISKPSAPFRLKMIDHFQHQ